MCFLEEVRLGIVTASFLQGGQEEVVKNSMRSEYIDGEKDNCFFYIGLKYDRKVIREQESEDNSDQWELKCKIAVGKITVDYNEMFLH
jgi:hypothetical protein